MSAQTEALSANIDAFLAKYATAKAGVANVSALQQENDALRAQLDESNQAIEAATRKLAAADAS